MAERAVQTFKEGMKRMNGESVETRVSPFLARYRIIPQISAGVSLAELSSRKETHIKTIPYLPRNWKEKATKSGFSETGA